MARRASYEITNTEKGWRVNVPAAHSATGARQRRYFGTQAEAEGFVRTLGVQIQNYGRSAQLLKPTEAEQAKAAMRLLEDAGTDVGLLEAVRRYLANEQRRKQSRPLSETIRCFLAAKRRSEKYTDSLNRTNARLEPLHEKLVSDITPEQIESVLEGTSDTYRNALLREIRAIFSYAVKRGWCTENPVARLDFARVKVGEREIYSIAEVDAILSTARISYPGLIPFLTIGLFAGVRVYELMRLDWRNVDIEEGSIDLPASITKRERRRSIPMESALKEWLMWYVENHGIQSGFVLPCRTYNTLRGNLRELFKAAGVRWRQNAARHSYASYWLAEHHDLTRLALHMGHVGGLEVLHMHYHRAVKKTEAAKFWAINPEAPQATTLKLAS